MNNKKNNYYQISWLPPWIDHHHLLDFLVYPAQQFKPEGSGDQPSESTFVDSAPVAWHCRRPKLAYWESIATGLREKNADLRSLPVSRIVEVIDQTAQLWGDPTFSDRVAARTEVVHATGFSPEVVDHCFDIELRNYRAESLWRVLKRELNNPRVLDQLTPDGMLPGLTHAVGPRVTLQIFTGNVPALPALSIVRTLLTKSAIIAKVASGEPTFASRFVRTLGSIEPRLADAIVITYWGREDEEVLEAVVKQADAVIAYGSRTACESIRKIVPGRKKFIEHGHKFSAGLVAASYLEKQGIKRVAEAVTDDVFTFNQHACIAPQVYFLQGDQHTVKHFGEVLAASMKASAAMRPLGQLSWNDAASLQMRRATLAWQAAETKHGEYWQSHDLEWTISMGANLPELEGSGNRVIHLVPVNELSQAITMLKPYANYLQNIGLGDTGNRFDILAKELAILGASRISEPGKMAIPSMMWRHDGQMCIANLLTWCDVEMHQNADGYDSESASIALSETEPPPYVIMSESQSLEVNTRDIPTSVDIIDCTLRDGEQAPGVWFTVAEKIELGRLLSVAGIDVLDAGFPVGNKSDSEAMQELKRMDIKAKIAATARPLMPDIRAAKNAMADEVFLFMPSSEFRIRETLQMTAAKFKAVFLAGAQEVLALGMGLNIVLEDATRAHLDTILDLIAEIHTKAQIHRVILADTVGCGTPTSTQALMQKFYRQFGPAFKLCAHCHNDFGLASANTLAAVEGGAASVTCTVNGIGERAGNADLAETVAGLTHLYKIQHNVNPIYLPKLARMVEEFSGFITAPTKPVTGFNVYRHESGVHVDGMLKNKKSYEFLPANWTGKSHEYILGKHSGRSLIRHLLSQKNRESDDVLVNEYLSELKRIMDRKSKKPHTAILRQIEQFRHEVLSGELLDTIESLVALEARAG